MAVAKDGTIMAIQLAAEEPADELVRSLPRIFSVREVWCGLSNITNDGIRELVNKFPNVRRIDLQWCGSVDSGAAPILAKLQHLEKVYIEAPTFLSDEELRAEIECWQRNLGTRWEPDMTKKEFRWTDFEW